MVMKNINEVIAKLIDLRFIHGPGVKVYLEKEINGFKARVLIKEIEYNANVIIIR